MTIPGDAIALREALSNLIHNAYRHGARRRLTVRVGRERGGCCWRWRMTGPASRAGNGPGCASRSGRRRGGAVGSGLGLSIAAEVAAAHGGEMRFETHSERGFSVILSLPDGAEA